LAENARSFAAENPAASGAFQDQCFPGKSGPRAAGDVPQRERRDRDQDRKRAASQGSVLNLQQKGRSW
jgi:hypothetical protein